MELEMVFYLACEHDLAPQPTDHGFVPCVRSSIATLSIIGKRGRFYEACLDYVLKTFRSGNGVGKFVVRFCIHSDCGKAALYSFRTSYFFYLALKQRDKDPSGSVSTYIKNKQLATWRCLLWNIYPS